MSTPQQHLQDRGLHRDDLADVFRAMREETRAEGQLAAGLLLEMAQLRGSVETLSTTVQLQLE